MGKKIISIILLCFSINILSSEEIINAETELLSKIQIGEGSNQLKVSTSDEEYFGPLGIAVSDTGMLFIPYSNNGSSTNIQYVFLNGKFEKKEINSDFNVFSFQPISQNGITFTDGENYFWKNNSFKILNYLNEIPSDFIPNGTKKTCLAIPNGFIFDVQSGKLSNKKFYAVEIENEIIKSKYDSINLINEWLSKNNSDFTIDQNSGFVKKNSITWSPVRGESDGTFCGKLPTGHNIYNCNEEGFNITDPDGNIIIHVDLPWVKEMQKPIVICSGTGPWGEIYYLIEPELKKSGEYNFKAQDGDYAKLVVVRNHLKYFGILNDDKIRLRKGPGTNTESLGTYPVKTGFRIIEKSGVKQTIGGITDEWIKVRLLDGTEGYFFGQYVQNLYDGPGTPLPWPNIAQ